MKTKILFTLLFLPFFSFSQDEIETDRPDQTECSSVVQPGLFQIELGNDYSKETNEEYNSHLINFASSLFRIGLFNRVELRLIAGEHQVNKYQFEKTTIHENGFSPIQIGTKISFCKENGIIPQTALIAHAQTPLATEKYSTKSFLPNFRFSMSHSLPKDVKLGYNIGMEWENNLDEPIYIYTFTIGKPIYEKFGMYIELFGDIAPNVLPLCTYDMGFTYLLKPTIQLDISGGVGLNQASQDFYIACGFSIRLPK